MLHVVQIADRIAVLVVLGRGLRQAELLGRGRPEPDGHSLIQLFLVGNLAFSELRVTATELPPTEIHGVGLRDIAVRRSCVMISRCGDGGVSVDHLARLYLAIEALFAHFAELIPASSPLVVSVRLKQLWNHLLLVWEPLCLTVAVVD